MNNATIGRREDDPLFSQTLRYRPPNCSRAIHLVRSSHRPISCTPPRLSSSLQPLLSAKMINPSSPLFHGTINNYQRRHPRRIIPAQLRFTWTGGRDDGCTRIICSTKWIRLEKPACEDLKRIANRFDGFRLLGITIDSVLARHRVNIRMCVYTFYVYVSSSKRVKERIWKKFVCAMAGFVVSLEYRDETCFFIPITLSFSF